jgi:hypothetical protein
LKAAGPGVRAGWLNPVIRTASVISEFVATIGPMFRLQGDQVSALVLYDVELGRGPSKPSCRA